MLTFDEALRLDAWALELIGDDVATVDRSSWHRPTPCAGWSVADLVDHMTTEHLRWAGGPRPDGDRAAGFRAVAARWLAHFTQQGEGPVRVPGTGEERPAALVVAVHVADMVVHRWDLAAALGRTSVVPGPLLEAAQAVGAVATAPSSPLVGAGRAYEPALPPEAGDPPLASLLRRYGRDPGWRPGS